MNSDPEKDGRKSLTRRDFTKKSLLAIGAAGAAGLAGYRALNSVRRRAANNLAKMGHCAPAVMQTLLEMNDIQNTGLILYAAGFAGGIAGSGTECGALTAPLMFMSYQNNDFQDIEKKINLLERAQSLMKEFTEYNGSPLCLNIRSRGMHECRRTIHNFHKPYQRASDITLHFPVETKESWKLLLNEFEKNKFHCAHNVLKSAGNKFHVTKDLLDASWIFIGGLAMLNRTCGALAAGVMALSSATAKIEDSHSRVAQMNRLLRKGDNKAMDESINNFNRSINLSDELGLWFRNEFGSTSCHDIWQYDFSKIRDVEDFITGKCMAHCTVMGEKVVQKIKSMN